MELTDPLIHPNTPEYPSGPALGPALVLGIYPGPHLATGIALRNPAGRPQLTWAALLAPTEHEGLADYADRITALATTVRNLHPAPVTVHLAGAPTGHFGTRPADWLELRTFTAAIALALDPPVVEIPYGDYHHVPAPLPSPVRDGRWPDGFGPRQYGDLTPVAVAALLTRWTPYPSPAPSTYVDRVGRLASVAPLSGPEERRGSEGDAPLAGSAAPAANTATSSTSTSADTVADGRR